MIFVQIKKTANDLKVKQSITQYSKENLNKFEFQYKEESSPNQAKTSRELPSWIKRPPSVHDLKNPLASVQQTAESDAKDKTKKKPKLF